MSPDTPTDLATLRERFGCSPLVHAEAQAVLDRSGALRGIAPARVTPREYARALAVVLRARPELLDYVLHGAAQLASLGVKGGKP